MTTIEITTDLIIAENREYLNREFSELKHFAECTKSSQIIVDPKFFSKIVRQFLDGKKFNKTHQDKSNREILAIRAAEFAKKCCTSTHNRSIVADHRRAMNYRNGL